MGIMANDKKLLSDYRADLIRKEIRLIARKQETKVFLNAQHKTKETKKHLKALDEIESKIDNKLSSLLELQLSSPRLCKEAEILCGKYRELNDSYIRHIEKMLSDDLARHQYDFIKNAGVFTAIVAGSITAATRAIPE